MEETVARVETTNPSVVMVRDNRARKMADEYWDWRLISLAFRDQEAKTGGGTHDQKTTH